MLCGCCGKETSVAQRFCPKCGNPLASQPDPSIGIEGRGSTGGLPKSIPTRLGRMVGMGKSRWDALVANSISLEENESLRKLLHAEPNDNPPDLYTSWFDNEVQGHLQAAEKRMGRKGSTFELEEETRALLDACKAKRDSAEAKIKLYKGIRFVSGFKKVEAFAEDYLDEMVEAGFQSAELSVALDLSSVSLEAIDPQGRRVGFDGFSSSRSNAVGKPEASVADDSFLSSLKSFIRAFVNIDWSDPTTTDLGRADEKGGAFRLVVRSKDSNEKFGFSYFMDEADREAIIAELFDDVIGELERGRCSSISVVRHLSKSSVDVRGLSRHGFEFKLACSSLSDWRGTTMSYESGAFRGLLLSFASAFVDVDWTKAEESLKNELSRKDVTVIDFEKIGLSKFEARVRTPYSTYDYIIRVENDKGAFLSYVSREKELREKETARAVELLRRRAEEDEERLRIHEAVWERQIEDDEEWRVVEEWRLPKPSASTNASGDFDYLDGHEFEVFCAALLERNGFSDVEVTKGSGDQGIDVLATKDLVKYGFQCKCYSSDVGNKAVQEAFAGKTYYGCHVAVVLTNRYFTPAAKELAAQTGVVLWDRDILLSMLE